MTRAPTDQLRQRPGSFASAVGCGSPAIVTFSGRRACAPSSRVPIAYSQGFSASSRLVRGLHRRGGVEAEHRRRRLRATRWRWLTHSTPRCRRGWTFVDVEARAGSLADRVTASEWEIRLPTTGSGAVSTAVRAFLEASSVDVERPTKAGVKNLDADVWSCDSRRRGIFRPAVCDTLGGCTARNTDRSTRRRPRRPPASGRPRAAPVIFGDPAGAGAARRPGRHGG